MNNKKIIVLLFLSSIVLQGIGINYVSANGYSKATNVEQLCELAFNTKIEYNGKGCAIDTKLEASQLKNVSFEFRGKNINGEQLLKILSDFINKKYERIGATGAGLVRAKEMFYNNLLTKIGSDFGTSKIQNNEAKKDLYSSLYLTLSVGKYQTLDEYTNVSQSLREAEYTARYGSEANVQTTYIRLSSGEVVELNKKLLTNSTVKAIIEDSDYVEPRGDESNTKLTRYVSTISQLGDAAKVMDTYQRDYSVASSEKLYRNSNGGIDEGNPGGFGTGISAERIEAAEQAKAAAAGKEFAKLSEYEQQLSRYGVPIYTQFSPIYNVFENGRFNYIKLQINKVATPRVGSFSDNDLIYDIVKNDSNIYIGLLIDGGLIKYNNDLLKQTGFYQEYVGPFYGDTDGSWQSSTMNGQNAEKILNYFGYQINLDPLSVNYLNLTYNVSNNQAIGQIDFIK